MKGFIELETVDRTKILININHIVSVSEIKGEYSISKITLNTISGKFYVTKETEPITQVFESQNTSIQVSKSFRRVLDMIESAI